MALTGHLVRIGLRGALAFRVVAVTDFLRPDDCLAALVVFLAGFATDFEVDLAIGRLASFAVDFLARVDSFRADFVFAGPVFLLPTRAVFT